ncbi:MAG: Zn-dependent hydrolase [Ignavibacteria bacterium GWA2_35_9]|nr:MAG: Zn-dependent hydrolase [Ignavibacteria bacterium GWA2_35_9]OGU48215.1 MAG: Zn-dependent hydrolase [Ignavibacteria bacterium GWB2_36_8]OGU51235.1 MAG: Zn-dependent hydrolase [Ignavibacteria bacterium GWC2_36_12]OGV11225.1 MAG: Zn-dependent hydrolase [Ignavibacteria bacterium RIFOXYB2_FULL_36_7]
MKRRNFIKRGLAVLVSTILLPPFFLNRVNSFGREKLSSADFKPTPEQWKENEINIAWIGHSTMLINFYGTIILTDPVLFERIGLYFFGLVFGPNRYSLPALEFDEIPKPDLVLLSHAHMDHMDYKTLVSLTDKFPGMIDCITAYNTSDVISDLEWKSLSELDWGEEKEVLGIRFKALEVKHFGWRFPWEKDRSKGYMIDGRSYNAYLIEKNGKRILFGGDMAFSDKLVKVLGKAVDIALMPIGAYNPWKYNHCNPEEALIMASEQTGAGYFIPMHCNTFKQGVEPIEEPLTWLMNSSGKYNLKVGLKNIGSTFTLS